MNYTRCFRQDRTMAYVRADRCNHAFVFTLADNVQIPADTISGIELLNEWNRAKSVGSTQQRALYFFSAITPADAGTFVQTALSVARWNRFTYWAGLDPNGGTDTFPNGQKAQIIIQQMTLALRIGNQLATVNDLRDTAFSWDGEKLKGRSAQGKWTIFDNVAPTKIFAQGEEFLIELGHPTADVSTGAIEISVIPDRVEELPLKIAYSRAQSDGDATLKIEEVLSSRVISELHPSTPHLFIALDPRDQADVTFDRKTQRSRVEFSPELPFTSHLQTDRGAAVMLEVRNVPGRGGGLLRFDVQGGTVSEESWLLIPGNLGFVPHGDFVFVGVAGPDRSVDRSQPVHRILTGGAATDFIELPLDSILRFRGDSPATLRVENDPVPSDATPSAEPGEIEDLLHDTNGYLTTAWVIAIHPDGQPAAFHTQPERSPIFVGEVSVADETAGVTPLSRKNLPYGTIEKSIPIFPFAGLHASASIQDEESGDGASPLNFEYTHLGEARRRRVPRSTAPSLTSESESDLGVTPQGIIAAFAGTDFSELRFGEPSPFAPKESQSDSLPELKWPLEYKLRITASGTGASEDQKEFYRKFQRTLRANDLFVVLHDMKAGIEGVISPAPDLQIRDFRFSLNVKSGSRSAFILKYFKDKSLAALVKNEALWACKEYLAPRTNASTLEALAKIGTEIPEALKPIWNDPAWQGILMLDLESLRMPDIFEALKPGMFPDKLRVHHFGLNFLPVKSKDLQLDVTRMGSAFGLLTYQKPNGSEPQGPKTEEKDPSTGANTDTEYHFVVEELKVQFANSQIVQFQAEVDARFSRLFWDKPSAESGSVHLIGAYEARKSASGETEDVFSLRTTKPKTVTFSDSWLEKFIIQRAEFAVTSSRKEKIVSFLGFSGDLKFKDAGAFNLFEVKSIRVERLGLEFDYLRAGGPDSFKCRFRADNIQAEIEVGDLQNSLLSLLPLKFKGFRVAIDRLLDMRAMGYLPLAAQFNGVNFHFAFDLELDMGFLGKLAGGKGLKLPLLLGWKSGGALGDLGIGISFPNWDGSLFEIGLQSFISLRADSASIKPCKNGANLQAIAIVLHNARLVFLGHEWPRESFLDFALFVPAGGGREMSWALARTGSGNDWLKYFAAGHRIVPPHSQDGTTKGLIEAFRNILQNVKDADACSLLPKRGDSDAWFVAGEFVLSELVHTWFAACDDPPLYGLRLELLSTGFSADAMYRQITERLGAFSAEVGLPDSLRTFQVGAATVRLPLFGVSVFTDGGFKVDFGYPWNLDFRRSFQLEIVIFLGSGGFWFGYTSASAATLLALEQDFNGFKRLTGNHLEKLGDFQAISAAMAMRAGIGRSIDLGILTGEASLTVFSTLEGAIAYRRGDSNREPKLFGIRGTMGIMIHIWVEVNFLVLRAKAEFCAYALVGFELRRVLALKDDGDPEERGYYYLTMPVKVFAEVGIYVHVEVWVTIGCVRVKLFDLSYRGTWTFEETIGGFSLEKYADLPPSLTAEANVASEGLTLSDRALALGKTRSLAAEETFAWQADYLLFEAGTELPLFASLLPCVGDPADSGMAADRLQPCVVMQLMLNVETGFLRLAQFMSGWALQVKAGEDPDLLLEAVIARRRELQSDDYWLGGNNQKNLPIAALLDQFKTSFTVLRPDMDAANYAALPSWPSVAWRFRADLVGDTQRPSDPVRPRKLRVKNQAGVETPMDGDLCLFVDYLRALTDSLLSEADRVIRKSCDEQKQSLELASLKWSELWKHLSPPAI